MKTRIGQLDKTLRRAFSASLVVVAYAGGMTSINGARAADEGALRSMEAIQVAVGKGDLDAMYWLAMMHIEGSFDGANYDRGMELLKSAAFRGNKDAERMFAFMDSAFSGEGC